MCKIKYEDNNIQKGKGTGFFCKIENIDNFPIKYGLFINNHILNEDNIGNIINIEYIENNNIYKEKKIIIDKKRKIYTNKELDYTCIEIYETDDINEYFKIDPIIYTNKKDYINNNTDIFILQYPEGNELCFSYGKIKLIKDNIIIHNASTKERSSGSPIIRRSEENYIIGLHYGGYKKKENIDYSFYLGTIFDYILNDIIYNNKPNEIECIYKIKNNDENEI